MNELEEMYCSGLKAFNNGIKVREKALLERRPDERFVVVMFRDLKHKSGANTYSIVDYKDGKLNDSNETYEAIPHSIKEAIRIKLAVMKNKEYVDFIEEIQCTLTVKTWDEVLRNEIVYFKLCITKL